MTCANPKLSRKKQLLAKIQSACTPETLGAVDGVRIYKDTAVSFSEISVNERNDLASASLSKKPNVMGVLASSITSKMELVGSGSTFTPPEADAMLRSSGLARGVVSSFLASGISANAPTLIEAVGGTSTAEIQIQIPIQVGDSFVYFKNLDANAIVSGESVVEKDGTATILGSSTAIKRRSIGSIIGGCLNVGEVLTGQTSGATIQVFRAVRNGAEYLYYTVLTGTVTTGETFTVGNRSVIVTGIAEDVTAIPITGGSVNYQLRLGLTVSDGTVTATILETNSGGETFVYVGTPSGTFASSGTLTAQGISMTASADQEPAGFVYTPTSDNPERVTVRVENDGSWREIYNAMSNVSIEVNANELPMLNFTTLGAINQANTKDQVNTPNVVFAQTVPSAFQGARLTLSDAQTSVEPVLTVFSFDLANDVQLRINANSIVGTEGSMIADRNPSGSIDIEQIPESQYNLLKKFFSGSMSSFYAKIGCEKTNTQWIFLDSIQYASDESGDNNGILTNSVGFGAKELNGAGDSELRLLFV